MASLGAASTLNLIKMSDEELLSAYQAGNESAFSELVKRYMRRSIQLAYVTIGNFEDAKDVAQEAFVKAHRGLRGFKQQARFSTWLYRIVMNCAKDFLRKKRWVLIARRSEDDQNYFERLPDPAVGVDAKLLGSELGLQMTGAIKELPFKQQWVFSLRFFEQMSLREISESTQMSVGAVKASLHFAIQKFRAAMRPYLEGRNE